MKVRHLKSMMIVIFIAVSGTAVAQMYEDDPYKQVPTSTRWAKSGPGWVNTYMPEWDFNLKKDTYRIRRPYLRSKIEVEANADLRGAKANNLANIRNNLMAQNLNRIELAKLAQEKRITLKQTQAILDQIQKEETAYILNMDKGGVRWPDLLSENIRFAEQLGAINAIFAEKSLNAPELSPQEYKRIVIAAKEMDKILAGMVEEVSSQTYYNAHEFINDLKVQAKFLVPTTAAQMSAGMIPATNEFVYQAPAD